MADQHPATASAACPFCRKTVAREIVVFGGACPHCLIDIPGEEAPTDPGEVLKQRIAEQERPSPWPRRMAWAALVFLVFIGLGSTIAMRFFGSTVTQAVAKQFPRLGLDAHRDQEIPDELRGLPDDDGQDALADASMSRGQARRTTRNVEAPPEASGQVEVVNTGNLDDFAVIGPAPKSKLQGKVLEDPEEVETGIDAVFQLRKKDIDQCFSQRQGQRSSLAVRWDVGFVVGTANVATDAWATPMESGDSVFQSCVTRSIRSWHFPRLAEPYTYTYTYTYTYGA